MSATTLKQRILLVVGGIFLTLVILEVGLRLGGWMFTSRQEHFNRRAVFNGNEFRILCLGESTTAIGGEDSYPFQLAKLLEARRPDIRWVVINRGMVSKTSADILAQLDDNLKRYKPDLVITMLGVNDPPLLSHENSFASRLHKFLRHSRVYHLFELLGEHLAHRGNLPKAAAEDLASAKLEDLDKIIKTLAEFEAMGEKIKASIREHPQSAERLRDDLARLQLQKVILMGGLGEHLLVRGRYPEAERILLNAVSMAPENYFALVELARCYRVEGQCEKAVPILLKAQAIQPQAEVGLIDLERCYADLGQDDAAAQAAQEILKNGVQSFWVYSEIGQWFAKRGRLADAEVFLKTALAQNPAYQAPYFALAQVYASQGKNPLSEEFRQKGLVQQKKNEEYVPATIENYRQIASTVLARGSRLIAMQYPLRHIEGLKAIFPADWPIIFVENRTAFLKALAVGQYSDYFSDYFAGDFGHCKRLGNGFIASQLADVIIQKVLPASLGGK